MFDGRWRSSFEQGLKPIGANIRRTGITADHLTATGVVLAAGASVAIANGALRAGLLLLVLCALPDLLDGAVAKASGTAGPRGAFFDSVSDRVTDALLLGGVAWYLSTTHPGRIAVLPLAVLGASMLISYERAKADALGFDARGGLMERAERIIVLGVGLLFDSHPHPAAVADARAHARHRRAALREGLVAGQRPSPGGAGQPLAGPSRRPADRAGMAAPGAQRAALATPPLSRCQRLPARRGRPHHPRLQAGRRRGPPRPPPGRGGGRACGSDASQPDARPSPRAQVVRNLRRVRPDLPGDGARRGGPRHLRSYARYWVESFRLPGTSPAELDAGFVTEGYEHVEAALAAGQGRHPGAAPPRRVGVGGLLADPRRATSPSPRWSSGSTRPSCSSGSSSSAARSACEVVPLGPEAGTARCRALKANHVLALLCDRDLDGGGVEVEFFGERTTLAGGPGDAGPAHRARRSCPPPSTSTATIRHGVVRPPLDTSPHGQASARTWPASPRTSGPRARGADPRGPRAVAPAPAQLAAATGATLDLAPDAHRPGLPVQPDRPRRRAGAGARAGPRAARAGHEVRVLGPCDGPPPDAGVTPARAERPDRGQRVGRTDRARTRRRSCARSGRCATRPSTSSTCTSRSSPGPTMTALLFEQRAARRARSTRRGRAPRTATWAGACARMAKRLDLRCAVSADARPWPSEALGGTTSCCSTASRSSGSRGRRAAPDRRARPSSSWAATSPARAWRCCWRRSRTCRRTCALWVGGDGPRDRGAAGAARRRPADRVAGADQRRRAGRPHARVHACTARRRCGGSPSAWCCSRRWLAAAPLVASDLDGYRNVARPGVDALLAPLGDAAALAKAIATGAGGPRPAGPSWWPAGAGGPSSSRWPTWPSATRSSTREVASRPARHRR